MIVVPLGVASATPTAVRHLPSVALWREGSVYLFDCGENAQMRMLQAGLKRSKIDCIFISHFDVDHYSGLMGLLSTLQLQRREKELTLVGPNGMQEYVEWNLKFSGVELGFTIKFVEVAENIEESRVVDEEDFFVEARPLKHRKFCLGYRFQEKDRPGKVDAGKAQALGITEDEHFKELKAGNEVTLADGKIIKPGDIVGHPRPGDSFAYITDTEYCPNSVKLAMNTNILYHEATFSDTLTEKARETGHSSASDAARVATESQTKLLVIGHFSARYTNPQILLGDARKGFYPTWLANELRPIFTDPMHEKGIVSPKVELKDLTKRQESPSGRYSKSYQGSDKNFRSRRNFSPNQGRGNSGDRYQSRGGDRYQPRSDRDRYQPQPRSGGDRYQPRGDRDRYQPQPRSGGDRYQPQPRSGSGDRYQPRSNEGGGYPDRNRSYGNNQYGSSQYSRNNDTRNSNDSGNNDDKKDNRSYTPRSYDDFDRF